MAFDELDTELYESFAGAPAPVGVAGAVEVASPDKAPDGSFRSEIRRRKGEAVDDEFRDAVVGMGRLVSEVKEVESEYFDIPIQVRLAGSKDNVKSLRERWESLTAKMGSQQQVLVDLGKRRRELGRDLVSRGFGQVIEEGTE
tara:strand:- start:737 stop:1165 length:429 start_codon:yes stop_codon:yes gene_type:complete